jgi:hypothetical protein
MALWNNIDYIAYIIKNNDGLLVLLSPDPFMNDTTLIQLARLGIPSKGNRENALNLMP